MDTLRVNFARFLDLVTFQQWIRPFAASRARDAKGELAHAACDALSRGMLSAMGSKDCGPSWACERAAEVTDPAPEPRARRAA